VTNPAVEHEPWSVPVHYSTMRLNQVAGSAPLSRRSSVVMGCSFLSAVGHGVNTLDDAPLMLLQAGLFVLSR
jgi:hypothetical protein